MTSSKPPKGPTCKHHHIEGYGFNIRIWGDTPFSPQHHSSSHVHFPGDGPLRWPRASLHVSPNRCPGVGLLSPRVKSVLNFTEHCQSAPQSAAQCFSLTVSSALPRDFCHPDGFKVAFQRCDLSLITGKFSTFINLFLYLFRFSDLLFCKLSGHIFYPFLLFKNGLPSFCWFARVSCMFTC